MAISDDTAELLSLEEVLQGALERVHAMRMRRTQPASQGEHPATTGGVTPSSVAPATAGGPQPFVMLAHGKRAPKPMSRQQLDAVDPERFDLLLDLVGMRLGFRVKGKRKAKLRVLDIRDTDLDTNDLSVFKKVLAAQGGSVSNQDVDTRKGHPMSTETMKKAICNIRKALGDDASAPRFIGTDSKRPRVDSEGFSYYVVRGVRACLIREAQ